MGRSPDERHKYSTSKYEEHRGRDSDRDFRGDERSRAKGDNIDIRDRDGGRDRDRDRNQSREGRDRKREEISLSKKKNKKEKRKSSKSKKEKKKKRDSSSSSGTDSDSSADSFKLLQKLEEERRKQTEEWKNRKDLLKALETPEEKRLRRLAKKDAKERKRKERMGWDNEYLHYTNFDNPFGDNNLLDTFVWKKKLEKEGLEGLSRDELESINRLKQEENKRELEKVKKRRIEREEEKARRDEEEALIQRQKEAEQFKEFGKQEDLFHIQQSTLRSKIRIKDGRAKPIDLLAQYISAEEELDAIEMHEPYTYLNGLAISDLEDLIEDIKVYKELGQESNMCYWDDMTVIVEDELRKLRKLEQDDDYRVALERREGINASVAAEVASIFKGKSTDQLQALKLQIQSKLDGSTSGVDISYWESLLSQLKAHIARARLRDRHQGNLKRKLALLKEEQGVDEEQQQEIEDDGEEPPPPGTSPIPGPSQIKEEVESDKEQDDDEKRPADTEDAEMEENEKNTTFEEELLYECISKYDVGKYSPRLITQNEIEPGIFIIGEDEDNARLELARTQVVNVGQKVENVWTAEEKALQAEAKKGMTNDEATFAVETSIEQQTYLWSDKYRPRKPRYFNRVHTGFEWNKYNQTHYDMDNPPPKIVQGYKFNIFFPDLIDKGSTPQYKLTTCKDNTDFSILKFHAGPPYEDIAFKIVNREWEYSYKRGFRCQFHNNIFQLWFHFKRYRYRR